MSADRRLTVLVVDDDLVDREAVRRSIRAHEVPVDLIEAKHGAAALELLEGAEPELLESPLVVLLDLNMPVMDGFEFLAAIRADDRLGRLCVFVLSTSSSELDKERAFTLRVSGYMVKDELGRRFESLAKLLTAYAESISVASLTMPSPH